MFGLAAAASCMPCQDEALKDRSSMPPVSVTMQPRNFPVVVAELDVDLGVELDELGALVAEPQAASSAAALRAATAVIVAFTEPPKNVAARCCGRTCGMTRARRASPPGGCPQASFVMFPAKDGNRCRCCADAQLRPQN